MGAAVDTPVSTLVNTLANTHVNTLVNTLVNIPVNTPVNTVAKPLMNTLLKTRENILAHALVSTPVNTPESAPVSTSVSSPVSTRRSPSPLPRTSSSLEEWSFGYACTHEANSNWTGGEGLHLVSHEDAQAISPICMGFESWWHDLLVICVFVLGATFQNPYKYKPANP